MVHVQLIVDHDPVPPSLQTALSRLGARVSIRSLNKAAMAGVSPSADVCVILSDRDGSPDLLEQVRASATNQACGTIVLPTASSSPGNAREIRTPIGRRVGDRASAGPPRLALPDATESLNADELTGRIKALCEIRHPMRRMQNEPHRLRERESPASAAPSQQREPCKPAVQSQSDPELRSPEGVESLGASAASLPADYFNG